MSNHKIKLKLKHLHWQLLANDVRIVTEAAPVAGWEIETLVIADLYLSKMKFFTVEPYDKEIKLSLTMVQAYAINRFLGNHSNQYNVYLRLMIEPKLLQGK